MSRGSVSAQQYLRKTADLVVTHVRKDDGVRAVVRVNKVDFVEIFEDDSFMTNTGHIFETLLKTAQTKLRDPILSRCKVQPALCFVNDFNPHKMLKDFDQDYFETYVLPGASEISHLKGYADGYKLAMKMDDDHPAKELAIVNELYSLFYQLRIDPHVIGRKTQIVEAEAVDVMEALKDLKNHDMIYVGSQANLLSVLKTLLPDGYYHEETQIYSTRYTDPFKAIGSKILYNDLSRVPIEVYKKQSKGEVQQEAVVELYDKTQEIGEALSQAIGRVVLLIKKPVQMMTNEEQKFVYNGGISAFTDEGSGQKLSARALQGLGIKIGVGDLETCIMRLANFVHEKTQAPMPECIFFAAGRLARMNSNKAIDKVNGKYVVREK